MLLWHRDSRPKAGSSEDKPAEASPKDDFEEKRQRALAILGERWLLHRANSPDRRPARSVLSRPRGSGVFP